MICPKDGVQLIQYKKLGEGNVDENYYDTCTVWKCPVCNRKYLECYITFEIQEKESEAVIMKIVHTISNILDKFYLKKNEDCSKGDPASNS